VGDFHVGDFQWLASGLIFVCVSLLLLRVVQIGAVSRFRFLFVYLIAFGTEIALLQLVSPNSESYGYIYFSLQSLNLVLACGVVREIFAQALAGHPGLAEFGRSVVIWGIVSAAAVALLGVALDNEVLPGQSHVVHRYLTMERSGNFILLLLLLMISVYLTWFPVKLRRNVVIYAGGFALFFFARAAGMLAINLLPQQELPVISDTVLVAQIMCFIFWIWGFRRESEDQITVTGHRWNPSEMDRLAAQLNSINSALERLGRR
jgi:hypothetical protein